MPPCHLILSVIIRWMRERSQLDTTNHNDRCLEAFHCSSALSNSCPIDSYPNGGPTDDMDTDMDVDIVSGLFPDTISRYYFPWNSAVIDVFPNGVPRISLALEEKLKSERKHASDNCLMDNIASKKPWIVETRISPSRRLEAATVSLACLVWKSTQEIQKLNLKSTVKLIF